MTAVLGIQVWEPGERADELLAAVAAALHKEHLPSPDAGGVIPVVVDDYAAARQAAEDALDAAGDDGRMIVRVLTP